MDSSVARIDAFTDSAFAFAVSLLVIGGAQAPQNMAELLRALSGVPSFAFGFGVIALFWLGHVRWRKLRGNGNKRSTFLTLLLIFVVLIYVQPLRSMAAVTALLVSGEGEGFKGSLPSVFALYGSGFAIMSALMAALFQDIHRDASEDLQIRQRASGERGIWIILAATGAFSLAISFTKLGIWAAMAYTTLPLTIGAFAKRHDWGDTK